MNRFVCVILSVIFILGVLSGCNEKEDVQPSATQGHEEQIETFEIKTAYCTLKYPEKWKNEITSTVSKDNSAVEFKAGDVKVFDILFNGTKGDVLGTIINDNGNTVVRVECADIGKSEKNVGKYAQMQEDVNCIVENLTKDYNFTVGEEVIDYDSVYEIDTDIVKLYYPKRWKDIVTVEQEDDSVRFLYKDVSLFDVCFNSDDGEEIGKYNDTKISFKSYEIDKEGFSDSEYNNICAMQEGVNTIYENLLKDSNFKKTSN